MVGVGEILGFVLGVPSVRVGVKVEFGNVAVGDGVRVGIALGARVFEGATVITGS